MTKVAALIVGIDGWEEYTRPLIESIQQHEPTWKIVVIDNESAAPYPPIHYRDTSIFLHRTRRLCYAAAIDRAATFAPDADWLIALSNDVICNGPLPRDFFDRLPDCVFGPQMFRVRERWDFIMGWFVGASRKVWDALGGWDANFKVSSWEDVDFSVSAGEHGFPVYCIQDIPWAHLDQRQRFRLDGFMQSVNENEAYFNRKHSHLH